MPTELFLVGADMITEIKLADGTRLGDNPDFIRMNVGIANFISEHGEVH